MVKDKAMAIAGTILSSLLDFSVISSFVDKGSEESLVQGLVDVGHFKIIQDR